MKKIAILYQAKCPPIKDGIQKPMKPGGYSDSGADIAYELHKNNIDVITPVTEPNRDNDLDWVFPDTPEGIDLALSKGANVFWLNTVLYKHHAIENIFNSDVTFVGQLPNQVDVYDDKLTTNALLKANGIAIPESILIEKDQDYEINLDFPLVVKPLRGRGSQGVFVVNDRNALDDKLSMLFSSEQYGSCVYVENYLMGQEITITVMPAGNYTINDQWQSFSKPWCLPAVKRFNHKDGVAPYNGIVAVIQNSTVIDEQQQQSPHIQDVYRQCVKSAELLHIKAPIRIDCRADAAGRYYLFDLNLKPNMTGPSRPHRADQDSLSSLAARDIGWEYFDLLNNMLEQRWKA